MLESNFNCIGCYYSWLMFKFNFNYIQSFISFAYFLDSISLDLILKSPLQKFNKLKKKLIQKQMFSLNDNLIEIK